MRIVATVLMAGLLGSIGCSNRGTVTSAANTTDSDLKNMVQSKLATDPQLSKIDVDADANHNKVTLSGTVQTEQSRDEAVSLAKAAQANLLVEDKIDVKPAEISRSDYTEGMAQNTREKAKAAGDKIGRSLDDAWIYTKVKTKLVTDSATPARKINVDVNDKVVTLRGEVNSATAKQEAGQVAQNTDGVKEVRNLLKVGS